MKRTDTKMILNLTIENTEFEQHIEKAIDKYIEDVLDAKVSEKVTEAVKKYIDKKIDLILSERRYDNGSLMEGKYLSDYIAKLAKPKVEDVISNVIAQSVTEVLQNKFKV